MTSRSHVYLLSLFHCKLIIIILNPNLSLSLSTLLSYNRNNNLFVWGVFCSYIKPRFGFVIWTINDFLDSVDFLVWEVQEYLLDFQHIHSNIRRWCIGLWFRQQSLSIRFICGWFFNFFKEFQNFFDFFVRFGWNRGRMTNTNNGLATSLPLFTRDWMFLTWGENLDLNLLLKVVLLLLTYRESQWKSYTMEMNSQIALPMLFRSLRSLALLPLIDLPAMNFRILVSNSLILRALEARCCGNH